MRICIGARRGFGSASAVVVLGSLVAACAPRVEGPAPVVSAPAPVERGSETITVRRGQSLSEIAQSYHVPMRVIAEANGLSPPYRIQTGRTLTIPGVGQPRPPAPPQSVAALPNPQTQEIPQPTTGQGLAAPRVQEGPSISPLPAPPPTGQSEAKPPPPVAIAPPALPDNPDSNKAEPQSAPGAGGFIWPVRGHVVSTYGSRPDGTHNDGINIAAARGASVQAVDSGVVAYTGNELRGYGNLVLVKHANGWISAYAHCDTILVKRGEKITRGQVIARVGSTGNVSQPQLHFELRRGQHAVDPREFLAPSPSAGRRDPHLS